MKREELRELGLTEEQVDKVMASHGKAIEAQKTAVGEKEQAIKSKEAEIAKLTEQLTQRDEQLETLKKVDAAGLQAEIKRLQETNATTAEEYKSQLRAVQLDAAVDREILTYGGKNPKAIKALIDYGKLELKDDGSVSGLDMPSLVKENDYMFGTKQVRQEGTGGSGGTGGAGGQEEPPEDYDAYKKWREEN